MIATLTTQAEALGYRVLVVTGEPRLAAAGDRQRHCALPEEGCLGAHPIHADGRPRRSTASLRRSIRILLPCAATRVDNLPGNPRRRREDRYQVESVSTATCRDWSTTWDKVRRQGRRLAAREHCKTSLLNRQLTEMVRDVPFAVHARAVGLGPVGPREDSCVVRRSRVSRFSAIDCSRPCRRPSPKQRKGSRSAATHSPRVRFTAWARRPRTKPVSVTA